MSEIHLDNVDLTFCVRASRNITLKEYLVKRMYRQSVNPYREVRALSGINLRIGDGDRLGILGHNGAGKSTILKTMAGIYTPTRGRCSVKGRICSLFDISLGFEMEANGYDNIRYRSYLQGETPRTLKPKFDQIVDFCGLGDFLNIPVRYYSAGMMIRLAFSIATATQPDILLIDEVLGVGDAAFMNKARGRMEEMMASASLMVFISHDVSSLKSLCNRAAWMDHGEIIMEGSVEETTEAYLDTVRVPESLTQAVAA